MVTSSAEGHVTTVAMAVAFYLQSNYGYSAIISILRSRLEWCSLCNVGHHAWSIALYRRLTFTIACAGAIPAAGGHYHTLRAVHPPTRGRMISYIRPLAHHTTQRPNGKSTQSLVHTTHYNRCTRWPLTPEDIYWFFAWQFTRCSLTLISCFGVFWYDFVNMRSMLSMCSREGGCGMQETRGSTEGILFRYSSNTWPFVKLKLSTPH